MKHAARFLLVAVSCIAVTGLLGAAPPRLNDPGSSGPISPGSQGVLAPASYLWFVELSSLPLAEALSAPASSQDATSYLARLHREKQDFRNAAAQAGVKFKERYSYDVLWNGLSVEVKPPHLLRLSRVAGVVNVWPGAGRTGDPGGVAMSDRRPFFRADRGRFH